MPAETTKPSASSSRIATLKIIRASTSHFDISRQYLKG
jgi:hypothetical protein